MTTEKPPPSSPDIKLGQRFPLIAGFGASSVSVATAVFLTNWIDVIKVRQQLAGANSRNLLSTGINIVQNEGFSTLCCKGVTPAVARGLLYGGLRIGLYKPFTHTLSSASNTQEATLLQKIAAGMLSGALAAGLCNPTDLVKTRMQQAGAPTTGPFSIASQIAREQGISALWKGTTPSMARAALLTAAQCATYDEVKLLFIRRLGWTDGIGTHLTVSAVAGLVTTTVTAPVDMIKTNMFVNEYQGVWSCIKDIYKRYGMRGMFSGFSANWARQGPMTTVVFVVNESLRPILGLESL